MGNIGHAFPFNENQVRVAEYTGCLLLQMSTTESHILKQFQDLKNLFWFKCSLKKAAH